MTLFLWRRLLQERSASPSASPTSRGRRRAKSRSQQGGDPVPPAAVGESVGESTTPRHGNHRHGSQASVTSDGSSLPGTLRLPPSLTSAGVGTPPANGDGVQPQLETWGDGRVVPSSLAFAGPVATLQLPPRLSGQASELE